MSITFAPAGKSDGINMANGNAMAVMSLLGMDVEYCGTIKSEDLIRRIDEVTYQSVRNHSRNPSISQNPGCATMIDCGRSEDYLMERLYQLRDLAVKNPGTICWC